jgi:hypothetical protein
VEHFEFEAKFLGAPQIAMALISLTPSLTALQMAFLSAQLPAG